MVDLTPVRRFVGAAARRLRFVRAVRVATRTLFYTLLGGIVIVALDRLFGPALDQALGMSVPWHCWVSTAGLTVLLAGIIAWFFPKMSPLETSARVDQVAGWKEKLSSLIALPAIESPMEMALLQEVKGKVDGAGPAGLFPHEAPPEFKWIPAPAMMMVAALLFLPPLDLLGVEAEMAKTAKEKNKIKKTVEKIAKKKETLRKKTERPRPKVQAALKELEKLQAELLKGQPERKQALAKLSETIEKLKDLKKDLTPASEMAEKIQKALSRSGDEIGKVGEKIKSGKFDEAAQELAKMRNKMQEGKMTEAERDKLAQEMKSIQKRLENDQDLTQFEKALSKGIEGLGKNSEMDFDDMQQMLQDMDGDLAQQQALEDMLRDLDGIEKDLAGTPQDGDPDGMGDLLEDLVKGEQCPDCQGKDGDCPTCQGQSCPDCQGKGGNCQKCQGTGRVPGTGKGGTGGKGFGRGGKPGERPTDSGLVKTRIKGKLGKGKIVGAWSVKGEPPKGEAKTEFEEVAGAAAEEAMDALSKQRVPARQRDYVRDYFDAIRGKNVATPGK